MANRIPEEIYHKTIDEYMESEEMREYLHRIGVMSAVDTASMIYEAPVSIEKKIKDLKKLLPYDEKNYIKSRICLYESAVEALSLSEDEYFILREMRYKYDSLNRSGEDSWRALRYYSFEELISDVRNRLSRCTDQGTLEYYSIIEKKTTNNKNKVLYSYCLIGDQIIACAKGWLISGGRYARPSEFYPPMPYKTGDVVMIDCRPFMPVRRGVILSPFNKDEAGSGKVLFRDEKGIWRSISCMELLIQPVYRITGYDGELSDGEELLRTVGRFLGNDDEKWEELLYKSHLWDYESCPFELSNVNDEDLLEYFVEQGLNMTDNEQTLLDNFSVLMTYKVEKKLRFGELYERHINSFDFRPGETYIDRMAEDTVKHYFSDGHRKSFVIKNRNNEEWSLISLYERNGSHGLHRYRNLPPQVKCIDLIYMKGFPVALCKVECDFMPPHLQVFIYGARFYCSEPRRVDSLEGAHLVIENDELYVQINNEKYHYQTDFRNDMLYYRSCPKGYEWLRDLTNYNNERTEGKERIRNWVT